MSDEPRDVEGIRAFRDHHGDNPNSPVHAWWRDVNTLLNAYDGLRDHVVAAQGATQDAFEYGNRRAADLRAERDVLASIVRDLAATAEEDEEARLEDWVTVQVDRSAWDRASDWVQAQTIAGGASTGRPE